MGWTRCRNGRDFRSADERLARTDRLAPARGVMSGVVISAMLRGLLAVALS